MSNAASEDRMVVHALARAGVEVGSVYDLVNTTTAYPNAIRTLIEYLTKVREPSVKEGIVRALSVKEARPQAARHLVAEFRTVDAEYTALKWTIGNALSVVGDEDVFEDIAQLATDRRHGKAREMLVVCLGTMTRKRRGAIHVLIELLNDESIAGHAVMALGRLRANEARAAIGRFVSHPKAWIRREARRALARIDKAK